MLSCPQRMEREGNKWTTLQMAGRALPTLGVSETSLLLWGPLGRRCMQGWGWRAGKNRQDVLCRVGGMSGSPVVLTPTGWGDNWGPTYATEGWRRALPSTGLVLVFVGSACDTGTSQLSGLQAQCRYASLELGCRQRSAAVPCALQNHIVR